MFALNAGIHLPEYTKSDPEEFSAAVPGKAPSLGDQYLRLYGVERCDDG
jgi:hypothetical protein